MKIQIENILASKSLYGMVLLLAAWGMSSCEDVIDLDIESGPAQLVVDGWITNQPGEQTVRLTWSASYFDNSPAKPALGAEVTVTDELGKVYYFKDVANNGLYLWGGPSDTLGRIGGKYTLKIKNGPDLYSATTQIKRVPPVDSLTYYKKKLPIKPTEGPQEGYVVQFFAKDYAGKGDMYWIKPVIDGRVRAGRATRISLAYDAAFNAGTPSDGMMFILPVRQSLTTDTLYSEGNAVGVELHSITSEALDYLKQIREQAGSTGLFATPLSNIKSNVVNADGKESKPLGFFGGSAVSRFETVIDSFKAKSED